MQNKRRNVPEFAMLERATTAAGPCRLAAWWQHVRLTFALAGAELRYLESLRKREAARRAHWRGKAAA